MWLKKLLIIVLFSLVSCSVAYTAPNASVLKFWIPHLETSHFKVDNSKWQKILDRYLVTGHASKVNLFDYARITPEDKEILSAYLIYMQGLDPRTFKRVEQKAYWINLYNALTIKLIIDNYPTASITKLGNNGPWDDEIASIQDQKLTLNDIEHGILRPIWKDNRIHYSVNCASISCPDLSEYAYSAANIESIMEDSANKYINHPRAVKFDSKTLVLSNIYQWYMEDFGDNETALVAHLMAYANPELKQKLAAFRGSIEYDYDWTLNKP